MAHDFIIGALILACLAVAFRDVATRTIPDGFSLAAIILGLALRAPAGWTAVATTLLASIALFLLLLFAFARGLMGGGDVKFAAAVSLAFAPAETWRFLVATSLIGGGVAAAHLLLRRMAPIRGLGRIVAAEHWRARRHGSLPYGVAIGFGAIWVLLNRWNG